MWKYAVLGFEPMTYESESECAIHCTTAPYNWTFVTACMIEWLARIFVRGCMADFWSHKQVTSLAYGVILYVPCRFVCIPHGSLVWEVVGVNRDEARASYTEAGLANNARRWIWTSCRCRQLLPPHPFLDCTSRNNCLCMGGNITPSDVLTITMY